ncbi:AEC family transporter [Leptolyngbya sp. KIOST-1]|uniref:AEC family transporter n=1 Tax=Leptolyngbya sp. KIOST-1 TaxID=1229172 RepID=UPI001CECCEC4|nr:AEC family transporter [Leptolyngbya sp. KIOST-1]
MPPFEVLMRLYGPIGAGICAGIGLGVLLQRFAPDRDNPQGLHQQVPLRLGRFLFWLGIPLSIIGFMRRADLSGNLYLAPVVAWAAILLGLLCSRLWIRRTSQTQWPRPTQGSFSLAAMLGNTGYIGYPVVLLLPQLGVGVFGWALFYDALGTLLGSYGLGAILATEMSDQNGPRSRPSWRQWLTRLRAVGQNPIILAFGLGLGLKAIALPPWLDQGLYQVAWAIVMLSLVLMGLRIQQLRSWHHLHRATVAVAIKMLVLPLAVGIGLTLLGVDGPPRLVMILQAGMPCAFSNLVLAEAYDLDRDLSVTCVGLSSASLLLTLPLWLWAFSGE